jgi:uncharacterized protein
MNMEPRMILFLLTFLSLYGGINFYFFFRARSIFQFSGLLQGVLLLLLILLILAPVLVRLAESVRWEQLARVIAYIGYVWMAFVFLFFFSSIILELIRVISRLIVPSAGTIALKTATFWLSAALAAALVVYGYIDAQHIRVRHLEVATDKSLPPGGKLRIVQVSDVHIGIIIDEKRLTPLVEKIREANPDLLVCTGDLLDGELDNIMKITPLCAAIQPKYGKFGILGNHEYYAGIGRALEFTRAAGFQLLRDDSAQAAGITIFGADDITGRPFADPNKRKAFQKALSEKHDGFVLYLKHQPKVDENARFDLMLSGHTHGGQLLPFRLIVRFFFPMDYGAYPLGDNKLLYVSRGSGTWGPPVRVFAPPEITVIDLISKKP